MNNNPQDAWENLFDQLPLDTASHDDVRVEAKDRALAAFDEASRVSIEAKGPQANGFRTIGQVLMRIKAPYWTAAMIAVGFFVWFGRGGTAAFAVENLVNNIVNCRTARYDAQMIIKGKTASMQKHLYRAPGFFRTESDSNVMIHSGNEVMTLDPRAKTARKISVADEKAPQVDGGGDLFETMCQALNDDATQVVEIGRKSIEGKKAIGFRFLTGEMADIKANSGAEFIIWADTVSQFPIEIEVSIDYPGFKKGDARMILKNYEFNVDLDDALFSMDVPAGYKLIDSQVIELGECTEEAFVASMKQYVEVADAFPSGLDPISIQKGLFALVPKVEDPKEIEGLTSVMLSLLQFPMKMSEIVEADAHYDGRDAKPGDETRPVYWYKPEGKESYRVIYADFTVKDSADAPSSSSSF